MSDNRSDWIDFISSTQDVLDVTYAPVDEGGTIVYMSGTALVGLSSGEFNKVISEAKNKIGRRQHILDRFEHWELPNANKKNIKGLLMTRAKTKEEKQLVEQYVSTL